jgi:DNA-directed RNA polymerase I subunit RPA2
MNYQWQALIDASDREIFTSLTCCYSDKHGRRKGVVSTELIGERAQIVLDEVRNLSLFTRTQCLVHIGTFWAFFFLCLRCLEDLLCADIDFDLPNAGQYFRSVMEGFEKDDYETVVFNVSSVFTLTYYWNLDHASPWLFYIV